MPQEKSYSKSNVVIDSQWEEVRMGELRIAGRSMSNGERGSRWGEDAAFSTTMADDVLARVRTTDDCGPHWAEDDEDDRAKAKQRNRQDEMLIAVLQRTSDWTAARDIASHSLPRFRTPTPEGRP